jgi:hypothetical protein
VVFVSGGQAELAVRRETYQDLVALDMIPAHLAGESAAKRAKLLQEGSAS